MTFSIIAREPETGFIGIATATGKIAVGAQVPHLRPGIGAIATQGYITNPVYAEDGFRLLEAGWTAKEVVEALTTRDQSRDWRQVLVMDRNGSTAAATGKANEAALGIIEAEGVIVGGNMLASDGVLPAMKATYRNARRLPHAARLLEALLAGEAAGGDKRGTCSAAILAQDEAPWPLNLRIDFTTDLMAALKDLYRRSTDKGYKDFRLSLPNRSTGSQQSQAMQRMNAKRSLRRIRRGRGAWLKKL
ncbi:MAG: DUF1028 domain-containing protein [Pseudomonadota bacterium]